MVPPFFKLGDLLLTLLCHLEQSKKSYKELIVLICFRKKFLVSLEMTTLSEGP